MTSIVYKGEALREIAFPLGGIGTGMISLSGRGHLKDFEIFNRPGKSKMLPPRFFAVGVRDDAGDVQARVLERDFFPPYTGNRGLDVNLAPGFARFPEAELVGEYPLARLALRDSEFPLSAVLEAFNPMIPSNPADSSLPVAVLRWRLRNVSRRPQQVRFCSVLSNLIGAVTDGVPRQEDELGTPLNEVVRQKTFSGVLFRTTRRRSKHALAGTMALVTTAKRTKLQADWLGHDWGHSFRPFWYHLLFERKVEEVPKATGGRRPSGTIFVDLKLEPGQEAEVPVLVTWHFPNRYHPCCDGHQWIGNAYTKRFKDALDVAHYVVRELPRLEQETRLYHRHFFSSTLPAEVLDRVSANTSIIRTNTCFEDAAGRFTAYEGCSPDTGCCPMNCTHVWLYEQALAFLFPSLERNMRENSFLVETESDGNMHFRTRTPEDAPPLRPDMLPAADGQMAEVVELYRDYLLCGDKQFLRRLWPAAKCALEYAWLPDGWDPKKRGLLEGKQHNTTDIEFYGPNPITSSLYLAALAAAARIARTLGDDSAADEYERVLQRGRRAFENRLFNGEYYQQRCPIRPMPYNQIGDGCAADQVIGQWLAHVAGVGRVLDKENVLSALDSVFRHNFRSARDVAVNFMRAFTVNDEKGVIYASFPKRKRGVTPVDAVFRGPEVWNGIEYQVASHMIQEGLLRPGLAIVRAIRDRHNGVVRNPWNEPECGEHYARSMASYALVPAYAGFHADLPNAQLAFDPRIRKNDFRVFWSVSGAWGSYRQKQTPRGWRIELEVAYGELTLARLLLGRLKGSKAPCRAAGRALRPTCERRDGRLLLSLAEPVLLRAGETLALNIR